MAKAESFVEGLDLVLSLFGAGVAIFGLASPDAVGPKLDEILDGIDDIKATLDDLEESILAELDLIRDAAITSALADSLASARGARNDLNEYLALANPPDALR